MLYKFLLALSFIFLFTNYGFADTLRLKNHRIIYGKVSSHNEVRFKDYYKVSFVNKGYLFIKKSDVLEIEVNDKDQFDRSK